MAKKKAPVDKVIVRAGIEWDRSTKRHTRQTKQLAKKLYGPPPVPATPTEPLPLRMRAKQAEDEVILLRQQLMETQNALLQRVNAERTLRIYEEILARVDRLLRDHFRGEYKISGYRGGSYQKGQVFD